eukprot:Tamp_29552.p1 GENE.Tamp_29552~~Tamp_29552.p1  ORF type:complete len:241 (-),score=48.17 Tamp_29552:46-717(-)
MVTPPLQGVAAFGHIAPPVVVYAKTPSQQRGNRALLCFPSEYTEYVFCVNAAGRKWDVSKRFKDFLKFENKLIKNFNEDALAGREPIPEKNFFLSNSPSFVEHRRWRLEMYINSLAHCPVVAHSDLFKDFLEYTEQPAVYGEEQDEHLAGLNAYDREQERIKMQKLAELAKMPVRGVQSEHSNASFTSSNPGTPAFGFNGATQQWAWAGDALSLSGGGSRTEI